MFRCAVVLISLVKPVGFSGNCMAKAQRDFMPVRIYNYKHEV